MYAIGGGPDRGCDGEDLDLADLAGVEAALQRREGGS